MNRKNVKREGKKAALLLKAGGKHQKAGVKDLPVIAGIARMTREGYIFVDVEGQENDIFIKASRTRGALNGDEVRVRITRPMTASRRMEGEVIEIVRRSPRPFVGILHVVGVQAWVLMQSRTMPYDISVDVVDADGFPLSRKKGRKAANPDDCTGALRQAEDGFRIAGVYEYADGERRELSARPGMKVAAVVDGWERGAAVPHGRITDVLGVSGENDTEMHAILAEYGLPYRFEPEVEDAADRIPEAISAKDLKGRRDFREVLTFTIDPADAKDFDDALSCRLLDNGNIEAGVHIADVSYYVKPGSAVDKEARDRGTSVYLVDRTVPMLPEKLSNKLCSLRPGEDKLTFSAVFELTPQGQVAGQWLGRTVIRSDYRFDYETAQKIIDCGEAQGEENPQTDGQPTASTRQEEAIRGGDGSIVPEVLKANAGLKANEVLEANGVLKANEEENPGTDGQLTASTRQEEAIRGGDGSIVPEVLKAAIRRLWGLAAILRKKRFEAGAVNFERPEMKVLIDAAGRPVDVKQVYSREANWLIEEFMLLANRTVAEFIATGGKMDGRARKEARTFVYRIHDVPNEEKLAGVQQFAGAFGYRTDVGETTGRDTAKALNKLLAAAKDKPEFQAIELLALRSMAKACYSTDNIGHYGLAFDFYTHFTSPIRRYPDTMVHRLLSMYLAGAASQNKEFYTEECRYASEREVVAMNAERDSVKYKLVEFMQDKVGTEYEGRISGLTEWGMYVEIDPTKIEGMVPLREVRSDFYEFDEEHYRIVGRRTGRCYRLGDAVRIRVKATNLEQRLLDYELVETGFGEAEGAGGSEKEGFGGSEKEGFGGSARENFGGSAREGFGRGSRRQEEGTDSYGEEGFGTEDGYGQSGYEQGAYGQDNPDRFQDRKPKGRRSSGKPDRRRTSGKERKRR